ncbi:esterase/lipase family protein [Pseudoxanthomonas wuyuanensis]
MQQDSATGEPAAELATHCTDEALKIALRPSSRRWKEGTARLGGIETTVEFRGLSEYFHAPLALLRARDVPMGLYGGQRFLTPGFGVPLAVVTPRCEGQALCGLLPPEGVFRWATAWFETDAGNTDAVRLVIADPLATGPLRIGGIDYPLALDTSAFYAHGARTSALRRLGIWGLLGGDEVGRRAGLYLLEDYDPDKRPVVMIHGLGSSPLAWARLSNAVWGDPLLRSRFQIWHVVYQTNAPLLVTRRRVQAYLDDAWRVLDPQGDDPARSGMVLIGHSMGGVVSRLLCVDSGEVLWWSAFERPPADLRGDAEDLEVVHSTFLFQHYPGVSRAIFLAAPHRGSPTADGWLGRLFRSLVGRRAPEMQSLRRIARANPQAVREELREAYQQARLNSISTLQTTQPVRRAGESLLPAPSIAYHTIAGAQPGREPGTDGVVPLQSALLPGAASTLVLPTGHDIYNDDEAIAEVLRILREDAVASTSAPPDQTGRTSPVSPAETTGR